MALDELPSLGDIEKEPSNLSNSLHYLESTDIKHVTTLKHAPDGVLLVPQPTDDPSDPLNWSLWKKVATLFIVSLASFIGIAQALANQSGFISQAKLYGKTPVELSYSVSTLPIACKTRTVLNDKIR